MSTNYPTSLDSLTNPLSTDTQSAVSHSAQHTNANDAITAIETKVGANGSAVTTTHDYKLSGVTGSDKAVSKTGTETLTNKTLTAPVVNLGSDATGDIYYRNSSGLLTRLPIGTSGQILDVSGSGLPEWISNPSAADATYATKGVRVLDGNAVYYAADAGSTDAYAITLSPAPSAYAVGQVFHFKANTINTGAATLNVNSLGAKTIVKGVSTTLADGDIAAGMFCTVIYDGTNFVLQNPVSTAVTPTFSGLFKNGITTKDSSDVSGTQTIAHGLGIVPKNVRITAMYATGAATSFSLRQSYTVYNGTTQDSLSYFGTGTSNTLDTTGFKIGATDGYANNSGIITVDATNITITWTKYQSPVGIYSLLWEAEA